MREGAHEYAHRAQSPRWCRQLEGEAMKDMAQVTMYAGGVAKSAGRAPLLSTWGVHRGGGGLHALDEAGAGR